MKVWNHVFMFTLFALIVGAAGIGVTALLSDKKVKGYYLESYQVAPRVMDHELRICCERDWAVDTYITLDRSVSYQEAIDLVADMNKKLNRNR